MSSSSEAATATIALGELVGVIECPAGTGGMPNLNTYQGLMVANSHAAKSEKRHWRSVAYCQSRLWQENYPTRPGWRPYLQWSSIVIKAYYPTRRIADAHNVWLKPFLDGMQLAGMLENDTGAAVHIPHIAGIDAKRPRYEYWVHRAQPPANAALIVAPSFLKKTDKNGQQYDPAQFAGTNFEAYLYAEAYWKYIGGVAAGGKKYWERKLPERLDPTKVYRIERAQRREAAAAKTKTGA